MNGLPLESLEAIERLIDNQFNYIGINFLGLIPKLSREKKIVFTTNRNSLTSLFLQSLGNRNPNKTEEDTLKTLLRIANGYLDQLREKTKTNIINDVNNYFINQISNNKEINIKEAKNIIDNKMEEAKDHFNLIINAETQKAINTGTAMQIKRIGESLNIPDPTVFFIGAIDERTCDTCKSLFFLPNLVTPRVYRLSELNSGYYKKGDQFPSISSAHPNCKHFLTFLSPGFGFDETGHIKFKGLDWDEFKYQHDTSELPITKK